MDPDQSPLARSLRSDYELQQQLEQQAHQRGFGNSSSAMRQFMLQQQQAEPGYGGSDDCPPPESPHGLAASTSALPWPPPQAQVAQPQPQAQAQGHPSQQQFYHYQLPSSQAQPLQPPPQPQLQQQHSRSQPSSPHRLTRQPQQQQPQQPQQMLQPQAAQQPPSQAQQRYQPHPMASSLSSAQYSHHRVPHGNGSGVSAPPSTPLAAAGPNNMFASLDEQYMSQSATSLGSSSYRPHPHRQRQHPQQQSQAPPSQQTLEPQDPLDRLSASILNMDPSISFLDISHEVADASLNIVSADSATFTIPYKVAKLSRLMIDKHATLAADLHMSAMTPAAGAAVSGASGAGMAAQPAEGAGDDGARSSQAAIAAAASYIAVPTKSSSLVKVIDFMTRYSKLTERERAELQPWQTEFVDSELAASAPFFFLLVIEADTLGVDSFVSMASRVFKNKVQTLTVDALKQHCCLKSPDQQQKEREQQSRQASPQKRASGQAVSDTAGHTDDEEAPEDLASSTLSDDDFEMVTENDSLPEPRRLLMPQQAAVSSDAASWCSNCHKQFSINLWKHHCRKCFDVFCWRCSDERTTLPEHERLAAEKRINIGPGTHVKNTVTNLLTGHAATASRICCRCALEQSLDDKERVLASAFHLMKLELPELMKLKSVSHSWSWASDMCLDEICRLQHCLPTHEFSAAEVQVLRMNREHLCGHSHWLVQLMKVIDWSNRQSCEEACRLLRAPRKHPCEVTRCSEKCSERLGPEEALALLGPRHPVLDPVVREIVVEGLSTATPKDLELFLPILALAFRHERTPDRCSLFRLLVGVAKESEVFRFAFYWELVLLSFDEEFGPVYSRLLRRFIGQMDPAASEKLLDSQQLVDTLEEMWQKKSIQLADAQEWLNACVADRQLLGPDHPLPLPYDPGFAIHAINTERMQMMVSKAKPIVIPFEGLRYDEEANAAAACEDADDDEPLERTESGSSSVYTTARVLFKHEDLRKDAVVMRIIRLMDRCLKENGLDLNILTYDILPTGPSGGFIQFVPDAVHLDYIKKSKYHCILNFLSNHNMDKTFKECQGTFMRSVAAYTVITFLLGVGDRHLENMMLTKNGVFFHIDYDFLLGEDPKKLLTTKMALVKDMVEAMGGEGSALHIEFKRVAAEAYNCLRKQAPLFINVLLALPQYSPAVDLKRGRGQLLQQELIQRFAVGKSDSEAETMLHLWMDGDIDSYLRTIHDFVHELPKLRYHYAIKANNGANMALEVASGAAAYVAAAASQAGDVIAQAGGEFFKHTYRMAQTLVGEEQPPAEDY